jgi:hypothetical protein
MVRLALPAFRQSGMFSRSCEPLATLQGVRARPPQAANSECKGLSTSGNHLEKQVQRGVSGGELYDDPGGMAQRGLSILYNL